MSDVEAQAREFWLRVLKQRLKRAGDDEKRRADAYSEHFARLAESKP